ncbi:unnamed protein product, partial [Mesorhabditis belari]|uniref:Uncharacterized protein n=1 Tax=Mesorhabditis belari TaxID=2138241 RepID=A0AAF3FPB2_9BILA
MKQCSSRISIRCLSSRLCGVIFKDLLRLLMRVSFFIYDFSLNIPKFWVLLGIACILQYLCIRFVYNLNATVEALTVTLVVTLPKICSHQCIGLVLSRFRRNCLF